MKTRASLSVLIIVGMLAVSGCHKFEDRIHGNGDVETELRSMPSFNRIINEGSFEVYLIQDSVSDIKIVAESNLIPHIKTEINGSTLRIYTRENLREHHPIRLYISTPNIYGLTLSGSGLLDLGYVNTGNLELSLSGSGNIRGEADASDLKVEIIGSGNVNMGVNCYTIETNISGSGNIYYSGYAETGKFKISGSGSVGAYELELKNCYTDISGSGSMFVNVSDLLDVKISGSGSVFYIGHPQITTHITGSGSVVSMN